MKFIVTNELGRLAKWLRILGFDAEYFSEEKEASLIIKALQEDKVVLTRNTHWGEHPGIKKLHIQNDSVYEQIRQVVKEFGIKPQEADMFTRCILCNEVLEKIEKDTLKDKVPEYVFKTQDKFLNCPKCARTYWQGSHWGNVEKTLKEIQSGLQ